MRLVDKHKKWMETGRLDRPGLCSCLMDQELYMNKLTLFEPNLDYIPPFWAYGAGKPHVFNLMLEYTPLRQTIVLLICAMHNEL